MGGEAANQISPRLRAYCADGSRRSGSMSWVMTQVIMVLRLSC